jgi:hypothetical protein
MVTVTARSPKRNASSAPVADLAAVELDEPDEPDEPDEADEPPLGSDEVGGVPLPLLGGAELAEPDAEPEAEPDAEPDAEPEAEPEAEPDGPPEVPPEVVPSEGAVPEALADGMVTWERWVGKASTPATPARVPPRTRGQRCINGFLTDRS